MKRSLQVLGDRGVSEGTKPNPSSAERATRTASFFSLLVRPQIPEQWTESAVDKASGSPAHLGKKRLYHSS